MIHSPTAFMKGTEIWLRYNEKPEPEAREGESMTAFRYRHHDWQSSFREVKFQDQEAARELAYTVFGRPTPEFLKAIVGGIPLDVIAGRIEIVNTCSCKLPTSLCPDKSKCDVHSVAVLLPEKSEPDESQEQLIVSDETIMQWAKEWGAQGAEEEAYFEFEAKEMLKHIQKNFIITRRK